MAVTKATTARGRRGWLPDNLNRGRLDLYYTVLVLLSAANVLFFLAVAHFYQYKKVRGPESAPPVVALAGAAQRGRRALLPGRRARLPVQKGTNTGLRAGAARLCALLVFLHAPASEGQSLCVHS